MNWNTARKDLNFYKSDVRFIRWFPLVWIGLVFLWGCTQMLFSSYLSVPFGSLVITVSGEITNSSSPSPRFTQLTSSPSGNSTTHGGSSAVTSVPGAGLSVPYSLAAICIVIMLMQFALHWICLSGRLQQRWFWAYFLFQSIFVLAISLIWSDAIIALGLYLVLIIEALSMFKQARYIMVIALSYLSLFIFTVVWQFMQREIWLTLESVFLLIIFIIGWIILSVQQVYARSQLETAHLQLAAYAMRIEELTLLSERQRLARELHDTLAQDLVGLTLQLERVDLNLDKKRFERARELVQQAMARSREALAGARSAIDDLRVSTFTSDDLLQALHREIARFRVTTGITCAANLSALAVVPAYLCEHVLRAMTEGLTNIARHAQASQVWINAQMSKGMLTIEIRDDGIGFDRSTVGQPGHYGLLGLNERAQLCGGYLDIESSAGHGTTLRLFLPIGMKGEKV